MAKLAEVGFRVDYRLAAKTDLIVFRLLGDLLRPSDSGGVWFVFLHSLLWFAAPSLRRRTWEENVIS